jgi:hypothetical protein
VHVGGVDGDELARAERGPDDLHLGALEQRAGQEPFRIELGILLRPREHGIAHRQTSGNRFSTDSFSTLALAAYLTEVNHFGKYPLTNRSAIGENISVI